MKKFYTLALAAAAATCAMAQSEDTGVNDGVKNAVNDIAASNKDALKDEVASDSAKWTFPGSMGINLSQTFHNDYSTEGEGMSLALDGFLKLNANLDKGRVRWYNSLSAAYGFNYSTEYTNEPKLHKTIDEFAIHSKYGYKANSKMYYSALASFETQFAHTYDYSAIDDVYTNWINDEGLEHEQAIERYKDLSREQKIDSGFVKNKWMNPAYVKASLGIDIVPIKDENLTIFISPITGRFTFCKDDKLAADYSMEEIENPVDGNLYKDVKAEVGAMLRVDYSKTFNQIIDLNTSLEAFVSYNSSIKGVVKETVKKEYREVADGVYEDAEKSELIDVEALKTMIGKSGVEEHHGFYARFKTDVVFKVSKYVNIAFRTQLKYDNAELSYHRNIKKGHGRLSELKLNQLKYDSLNKENNWGYKKAYLQFWESTSLGVAYIF